jgi:ADP-ribose pyrophosphatase YjhB (NUDIX family)
MRRNPSAGIAWQFPAGIVKPGEQAEEVAIRETRSETGVHCIVRGMIGSRVHPVTNVHCCYFACDYLMGDAANGDPDENATVAWVSRRDVTRFIDKMTIYPPALELLEGSLEPAAIR